MRRGSRRGMDAQAVLETALVIPILLLLVCNFLALMVQVTVQQQLDSAVSLAAELRFQATVQAYDPPGSVCCPDPRCCGVPSGAASLPTGSIPTGCRLAGESFYGTMQQYGSMLVWQDAPLCLSGGDSASAAPMGGAQPYPRAPTAHVACVVAAVDPSGVSHPGFRDLSLDPPHGLSVVTCDATVRIDFSQTPLGWGVFWSPTLHAHAEALPPPFRQ